jgi:hypothetical protein
MPTMVRTTSMARQRVNPKQQKSALATGKIPSRRKTGK